MTCTVKVTVFTDATCNTPYAAAAELSDCISGKIIKVGSLVPDTGSYSNVGMA